MIISKNIYLALIISALLSCIVLFFGMPQNWNIGNPKKTPDKNAAISRQIDYSITNFTKKKYSDIGIVDYRLSAESLNHYLHPILSELKQPRFVFYIEAKTTEEKTSAFLTPESLKKAPGNAGITEQRENWVVSANYAKTSNPEKDIFLTGNVILSHFKPNMTEADLRISSVSMTLKPENKIITSDQLVQISSEHGNITGKDFLANLNKSTLTLKQDVNSTYQSL